MTTAANRTKVIVTGAGGAASIGFCRSLRESINDYELIGFDSDKYHLCLAEVDHKYLIPKANDPDYIPIINHIANRHKADFLHSQPDPEIEVLSENREKLDVKTNFPEKIVVRNCLNKYASYQLWRHSGIPVPETMIINSENDLKVAFENFGKKIWIRDVKGAAGRGSLPTSNYKEAVSWIDFCNGWGHFTASEYLTENTITWQSIWNDGKLVIAQTRLRKYWEFANRSPSGVTGLTGTGVTISDTNVDTIALKCIKAISANPNGIFSVDMTYDKNGSPNPTEINIGRFFTTHHFFTKAGINFPDIFVNISIGKNVKVPSKNINPLCEELAWVRGIDSLPYLTNSKDINKRVTELEKLRQFVKTQ